MEKSDILLSICIPTYNRARFLNENLFAIFKEIKGKVLPLEIIISDNCSSDDTADVVFQYINDGMPINYIQNSKNVGMDRNFAQCYRAAKGRYVLVLGDDDYFIEGKLDKLLTYLDNSDYGLVHLQVGSSSGGYVEFMNNEEFLKNVSYWITYITSNIVNRKCILKYDFEQYFGTYLTIMPLYIESAFSCSKNLLIKDAIFYEGKDSKTNGGYNFFAVFVDNYLLMWKNELLHGRISKKIFYILKYDIYRKFIVRNTYNILILRHVGNYNIDSAWRILIKNYGMHFYFYYLLLAKIGKETMKSMLFFFNKRKK